VNVELESQEVEQLIELLTDCNGDWTSILRKLGFRGTTVNGDVVEDG
jgi:hypothetical protein